MSVRVEGISEAMQVLTTLEQRIVRRVVTAASRAGGAELLKRARSEAPSRTGLMRRQLRQAVRSDSRKGTVTSTIWPRPTKAQRAKGHQPRGRIVHLVVGGTRPHDIPGPVTVNGRAFARARHPGSKPNPFMDRAANAGYTPAVRAFGDRLQSKLDEEVQKVKQ